MLVGGAVQDLDSWAWGYHAYGDINAFLYAQERGFTGVPGGRSIYADKIHFSPPAASGAVATFPYISKRWARDPGPDGYNASRSEEHPSELQTRLCIQYPAFSLNNKRRAH